MNEIIEFPRGKELAVGSRLDKYFDLAIDRFNELKKAKLFNKDTEWEHERWSYLANGGENVLFCNTDTERNAAELTEVLKAFQIDFLYQNRLKGSLPSLAGRNYGFRTLIQTTAAIKLTGLNQDAYLTFLNAITTKADRTQSGLIAQCNSVIRWLQQRDLLTTHIDLARPPSLAQLPAIASKMPSRDLIQTILEAKWKVAEAEDDSLTWVNDMLSILAQSFQYGMGLRIGEVLRLPSEPLKYADGKMFFIAWTEKGKPPLARYVPKEWHDVFEYTVNEIKRITEPYRKRAKELEERGRLSEVEERLKRFNDDKQKDKKNKLANLEIFFSEKKKQAEIDWATNMRGVINPDRYYSVSETRDLLPMQVTSDSYANRLAKRCLESAGLTFHENPLDTSRWTRYRIKGSAIQNCIKQHIAFRGENLSDQEFLSIMHERVFEWESKENKEITKRLTKCSENSGSFKAFTMRGACNYKKRGYYRKTMTKADATDLIELYCMGGYDSTKWIDLSSFLRIFGDLYSMSLASYLSPTGKQSLPTALVFSDKKIRFYGKTNRQSIWCYQNYNGYLLKQDSIHDFILQRFKDINLNIEQEIYEESLEIDESRSTELAVIIDTKSFRVMQKVSDYLMLTGETDNGGGKPLIPSILSYNSLTYAFKGGGRNNKPGLFQRYQVTDDVELTKEFQTHKGRHWKTTSLFRSGASHEVVNLWMGRDPSQGSQYDHNTDHERAKKIKEAMKHDSSRFVGHIAIKLRQLQEQQAHEELIDDYLNSELQVVQHSPTGMCTRELAIKPCDITMRCLHGKDGKGCKNFIFDLADIGQVERLSAWADQEQREVTRLESLKENGYAGAQMHLDSKIPTLKNAEVVLKAHKIKDGLIKTEIRPFRIEGSDPNDCPFECGE